MKKEYLFYIWGITTGFIILIIMLAMYLQIFKPHYEKVDVINMSDIQIMPPDNKSITYYHPCFGSQCDWESLKAKEN